eukprot:6752910-Alexandrium_andersonii.AAC.1
MNTKYPQKVIGFAKAITPFAPRGDRAADQARGLRRQARRQWQSPACLGPGATTPRAQEG